MTPSPSASEPRLRLNSWLLAVIAFNLIFFLQELFLVLPKALTPGLKPILFHNNHDWTGDNRLAELFQGTGALAIFAVGLAAILILRRRAGGSATLRLLLVWIAFNGLFQSLPQLVIGAFLPGNDVARALAWLGVGAGGRAAAAMLAVFVMMLAGRTLVPLFRAFDPAARPVPVILRLATVPGLAAIPVIWLFRVPGGTGQVVLVPVLMIVSGLVFVSLGALWAGPPAPAPRRGLVPALWPALALAALLLIFQIILRPGIPFY
jgi:hypothetical protein